MAKKRSVLEMAFANQVKMFKLPEPEVEFKFDETRKWRFDFAWPELKVAVEIEGGTWSGGAHTRGAHFAKDCEKYNAAAELGWLVFRFPNHPVQDGTAALQMKRVLDGMQERLDNLAEVLHGNPDVSR